MTERYDFDTPSSMGEVHAAGVLKKTPDDFMVTETLSFIPSGEGDHVYLLIQKTDCTTDWVGNELSTLAGLKQVDVGYAGMKDRFAVTTQWFSLHMPNQPEPDWNQLPSAICVLDKTRHNKKLRTGAIEKNTFKLVIRDITFDETVYSEADGMQEIERRLSAIKAQGFPNYFGPQRFGNQGANVHKLAGMARGRRRVSKTQRGMYISSGRSYLFNQILKARIELNSWNQAIEGDVMSLQGSRSVFVPETLDQAIFDRMEAHDIHPAAIMWGKTAKGKQETLTSSDAKIIEDKVINAYPVLIESLQKAGVEMAYRAMRVTVPDLTWEFEGNVLKLSFSLASGAYATTLLGEVIKV